MQMPKGESPAKSMISDQSYIQREQEVDIPKQPTEDERARTQAKQIKAEISMETLSIDYPGTMQKLYLNNTASSNQFKLSQTSKETSNKEMSKEISKSRWEREFDKFNEITEKLINDLDITQAERDFVNVHRQRSEDPSTIPAGSDATYEVIEEIEEELISQSSKFTDKMMGCTEEVDSVLSLEQEPSVSKTGLSINSILEKKVESDRILQTLHSKTKSYQTHLENMRTKKEQQYSNKEN